MSGLHVTICFSADKYLLCLNSMSPETTWNHQWQHFIIIICVKLFEFPLVTWYEIMNHYNIIQNQNKQTAYTNNYNRQSYLVFIVSLVQLICNETTIIPMALARLRVPLTRPTCTKPPASKILSLSNARSGLWSLDISIAYNSNNSKL
jgi:hypothetical protein